MLAVSPAGLGRGVAWGDGWSRSGSSGLLARPSKLVSSSRDTPCCAVNAGRFNASLAGPDLLSTDGGMPACAWLGLAGNSVTAAESVADALGRGPASLSRLAEPAT